MIELLPEYHIALKAATAASEVIMAYYTKGFESTIKNDGSPVTQADLASSEIINNHLFSTNIPITGEESKIIDYQIRKNWTRCWCVDPLDGTKEFIKRNGEFAINIALIENTKPIFGLIASPTSKKILFGGKGMGAYLSHFSDINHSKKWQKILPMTKINSPLMVIGSRSHHSGPILNFLHDLRKTYGEIDFIKKGSSLKFFDLALGKADVYPRFAPTMEWDIASGQAIMEALGGEVVNATTFEALNYNKEDLYNPYFIVKTQGILAFQ